MSRAQLIFGLLGLAFISQVAAHGHLSVPTVRDANLRQDQRNAPVTYPLISDFVCRNYSASPSNTWTTLVAGSTSPIVWAMEAAHPGDCFVYLSYDGDEVEDTKKKWFKIAEFGQCNLQNTQTMTLNIPSYLPPCEHCILRWEWYALHLQAIDIVEFYGQCADVKIVGNPNGQLPSPQVTIPGHIPMDAKYYRPGYNSKDLHYTGPPVATIGGAAYDCVSTYGSSCNVPSPTNNPCTISTQRCMSATTYQACGIGATTTVWGPEQSCQTGLVCANHTDGVHIMCTYPSAGTPSANPSTPSSTPSSNSGDQVCTLGNMKCIGDSSYQTCANGNSGSTYWAAAQSCQTGQYCNPNGATVYCALTKPAASTPTPTPTPVAATTARAPVASTTARAPTPAAATTARAPVASTTARASVASTTARVSTPTTPPTTPSTSCKSGDQRCTGTLSSTYQTCTGAAGWASPQSCQPGLFCNPSATGNNIYCY